MKLDFTHSKKTISVPYGGTGNGFIKLYKVPSTYSDDGYYAAVWQQGELEAVPGCDVGSETLLAHVAVDIDGTVFTSRTVYLSKGVTYAQS